MKKILIILLILLLSQFCFAGRLQEMQKAVIAAKNGAGGECSEGSNAIIIGEITSSTSWDFYNNTVFYMRYQALYSCTIDTLGISFANSGSSAQNFRLAIFSDNAGEVGTELSNTNQYSTAGNNSTETVECLLNSSVSLTSGNYYWLAAWSNAIGVSYYVNSVFSESYSGNQSATYSSTGSFPSPSRTPWYYAPAFYGLSE